MKKLLFAFVLFIICSTVYSQFESVPLRLVTAEGLPHTGQSSNITFRRSPFGAGNVISGLTVTEIGTAGNYIVNGFTTFERAKLFISGVEQTWWGGTNGLYVGDLITYLNANYGRLGSSNDWTGATNQFMNGLFHDDVYFEDVVTGQDFQMETMSNLYLWVTSPAGNNLIWKNYADSIYGEKKWWINGFKMRLLPGYKWVGYNSSTPPIPVDASDLTYDETIGLGVGSTQDSTAFNEAVTIYYDSTDGSENNYRKTQTDYLPNYKNPIWDSLGAKTKYQRITNGTVVSEIEYYKANNAYFKELELLTGLTTSDQIIDTLTLPRPGLYQITSVFTVHFVDHSSPSTDSITVSLDDASLPGSSRIAKQTVTYTYGFSVTTGLTMTVTVTALFYRQGNNNVVYLMAHNNQSGSSLIHEVWKTQTTAINIY
ncbi:MAG: hypothetical protein UZ05_CHB002000252 [Chlorobi bacterium OLB5]|nr:MAG: hypothetical protein UZ05_CHB002000252 [Chlorobi bacterium OLB5]